MKKNLIALAVLAASGVASAQSSVTLYGIADVWVGSVKTGVGAAAVRQSKVDSGGVDASRWGLRGSEDLGGGLKANFVLEQGFNVDNGAAVAGFNRQAYLGLSGGFGEVKIGKVYTAYDDIADATYSSFSSEALAAPAYVFATSSALLATAYNASPNNTIAYYSPKFNGFSGAVSYSLGENKTAAGRASSTLALNAQYANGPIYVGFAHQVQKPAVTGSSAKYTLLNGSYDFGVVKLLADYAQVKDAVGANSKSRDFHIGADVPLASNVVLSGGYARSQDKNAAGAKTAERSGYSLALAYVLSKRTTAYAGLNNTKWENGTSVTTNKVQAYAVGVKHAF